MTSGTLVRQGVPDVEVGGQPDIYGLKQLATEAEERFGYTYLKEKVDKDDVENGHSARMRFLAEIDTLPFTEKSVRDYKAKKVKEDTPLIVRWFGAETTDRIAGVYFLLLCLFAFVLLIANAAGYFGQSTLSGLRTMSLLNGVFISLVVVLMVMVVQWDGPREPSYWNRKDLRGYEAPIPEFALACALEVEKKFPGGYFYVEEFISGVRLDPFLVWKINGSEYHLHVWNEADFKGEREV